MVDLECRIVEFSLLEPVWMTLFCSVEALKQCFAFTYTFLLFGVVLHAGFLLPILVEVAAFQLCLMNAQVGNLI